MLELLKLATASLLSQRARTFLTMFGIVWGIAAVIILVSIVGGFKAQNDEMWLGMGIDKVQLRYSDSYEVAGTRYPLVADAEDADFIVAYSANVRRAGVEQEEWRQMEAITGASHSGSAEGDWYGVVGMTPPLRELRDLKVEHGRFLSTVDYDQASKVVVIGNEVAKGLWGEDAVPVGEILGISGTNFTVVGITPEDAGRMRWRVLMPLQTYETSLGLVGQRGNFSIMVEMKDPKLYNQTVVEIRRMLAARHGFDPDDEDAIRFEDFARWRERGQAMFLAMFVVFYFVGVMTLAIGAVGVMNILLVSVRERTREIGLRKALGAPRRSVLAQFLLEALILTTIGGAVGIALGLSAVGMLRGTMGEVEGFPTPVVTMTSVYAAIAVNLLVGILAGTYPARQAATVDPIVALRAE
ncbi:ABC transporter permease [bacterium]|nr:ABC transporter permease [bacterium]